nr:hypothetical protein [Kibdelosporangium sp. MJ126-NF4]CTQ95430.1 hypothetical protein [Kibdelosporangium sp. MJ126-NF4]
MPTNELTATTLADLSVVASHPSWRGFTLHSLVIVAMYRCAACGRSSDSLQVASQEGGEELLCPRCFGHLVRTEQRSLPAWITDHIRPSRTNQSIHSGTSPI